MRSAQRDENEDNAALSPGKVLVVGDDTRGFLATVRSLGRQGVVVHAAPADFRSPALVSRYIRAIHDVPPWMGDGAGWRAGMHTLLRAEGFDLVIPCDERAILPLQRHRTEFEALARLALPDDAGIAAFFDKHHTRELAQRMGVAVSPGRPARPDDTAASVLAEFGAPVVVKPRKSYTLDGLASRGRVHVVSDERALQRVLAAADPDSVVLEACFHGRGLGLSLLASNGRVLQAFEHHRVREQSGSSFYRVSAALSADLVRACAAIVQEAGFTGVGMFEFKRNQEGGWVLLEINARPWGSLPLPVALGVDFPYRWFRLLVAGEETPAVTYRVGVFGRNLLSDLQASVAEAQARRLGPAAFAWFMAGRVAELLRVVTGHEVHDVLVPDDLRPGMAEIWRALQRAGRRVARAAPGAAGRAQTRARAQLLAMGRGAGPVRIVFVCQGNICRSPLAAALLESRLAGRSPAVKVASAGMMPRPGRPTPDDGITAARALGADLAGHRSTWLTRAMAQDASLLVVFDDINQGAICDRYPDLRTPMLKLGELVRLGDITDPVDCDLAGFQDIYARIDRGVAEMARLLPA